MKRVHDFCQHFKTLCFVYLGGSHFHVGILIILYFCMSLWSCIVYGTDSKPCFLSEIIYPIVGIWLHLG